jgi:uncharacterized membrane protein (UPF0127 family)
MWTPSCLSPDLQRKSTSMLARGAAPRADHDAPLAGLERRPLPGGMALLVAAGRRARRRGLAHLDALPADHALLLEHCRSVHTFGMRFALDLLWLDAGGALVRHDRAVGPRRLRSCLAARAVIETVAGDGDRFAAALPGAARRGAALELTD